VSVTHDGAQFHERVQRLLADLEEAESSLGEAAQRPRGKLRVDVPSPLARLVLVPALADFTPATPISRSKWASATVWSTSSANMSIAWCAASCSTSR
jgi:DNA-binding transcriptional LysR family regulator